jgi:DNA-binding response OmpR family regulator
MVLRGRKVLLVEDEALVAWLIEDMLIEMGCEVLGPAETLQTAMSLIEAETPEAAVLDVNLGKETSFPVAAELAARHVPFVFATGYAADSLPAPFADRPVVPKPPERKTLKAMLEAAIGHAGVA